MWAPDPSQIITAEQKVAAARAASLRPLSPRQLWLAAARIAITKDQVLAMVDAMEDQEAALDLQIEINEAPQYERDHPAMDDLRDLMGIPPEQFDDLWIWASGL